MPAAPPDGPRRLAVRVTKDALRQVRGGHPWIFDAAVVAAPDDGAAGDLAVVFDDRRRFAAIGLWDPASPIRVRVLHHGRPRQIDADFWTGRLLDAHERRGELVDSAETTAWRWVHGENDGLPGLVVDRYGDTLVVKLYSAAWFPHLEQVVAALRAVWTPERIVLRLGRVAARHAGAGAPGDGTTLVGAPPEGPVPFLEHGLHFEADVVHGQKTGHFLDQRDNRALVGGLARGRRVLDVFSCTGGFTVHAAAGGASLVHSVDLSAPAITAARANLARNDGLPAVRACRHESTVGDAAEVMAQMVAEGRRFDVVVVDPPSFASRKDQVAGALRAYARLTELAVGLVEQGGTLVQASCSARVPTDEFVATVRAAADRAGVGLRDERRTGHAVDHPVGFAQGEYLKAVVATVVPRG